MDRSAILPLRRLMLLLVTLALLALIWFAARPGSSPVDAPDTIRVIAPPRPAPPWLHPPGVAVRKHNARPELLPTQGFARRLMPPAGGVLAAGFAQQEPAPHEMDDVAEPRLVAPSKLPTPKKPARKPPSPDSSAVTAQPGRSDLPGGAGGPARATGDPTGSLLVPQRPPTQRSKQLEQIARQADRLTRHGFELAGRKAYFAARAEFIRSLRLVAQGLDAENQTTAHSRALAAALTAISEADDFLPQRSALEADLDIPAIIDGHRTPVLKDAENRKLTPMLAMKCYLTFAQEQLAAGCGREIAGSMALHGLGKLYAAVAGKRTIGIRTTQPKAVVFYQAALLVDPLNQMASNDLGVLLAGCGNCPEAKTALEHSLSICPRSTTWKNLAEVYRRLGQAERARRADRLAAAARQAENTRRKARYGTSQRHIRWVDPNTFAKSYAKNPSLRRPAPARAEPAVLPTAQPLAAAGNRPAATDEKPAANKQSPWGWIMMQLESATKRTSRHTQQPQRSREF